MKNTTKNFSLWYDALPLLAGLIYAMRVLLPGGGIVLVVGAVLVLPYLILRIKASSRPYQVAFIVFLLGSALNVLVTDNGIGGCVVVIGTFAIALYCIENLSRIRVFILVIFLFWWFYLVYYILVLGIDPNVVFELAGLSRNHGGLLVVTWSTFYCFVTQKTKNRFPLLVPALAMYAAWLCEGRSSLGMMVLLFVISFIAQGRGKLNAVFVALLAFSLVYFRSNIEDLFAKSSFERYGMGTSRYDIWSAYIDNLNIGNLLLGVETNEIPLLRAYAGNPHNSFLNLHRRMGLLPFLVLIGLIVKNVVCQYNRKEYYGIFVVLILLTRLFFDSDYFIGTYDYVVYAMLLYPIVATPIPNEQK